MPEEKTENRFIRFLEKNRKIFLPFKYFVYLTGIVVIILFVLDFSSQALLGKDYLEEQYWNDHWSDLRYHYEPYLDFGTSYRETKNPCKDMLGDPLLIYTFGGSTIWAGYDEGGGDIASYISELLCKKGILVEVKNFGIPGYVSTSEIIKLFLELEDDKAPDIVVFYDGANEIEYGGYLVKTPEVFKYFAQKMNYQKGIFPNLKKYLGRRFGDTDSSLNFEDDILDGYFSKFQLSTDDLYGEELYRKVMEIYLNNVKIVRSMEEDWGFKSFFYWQPSLHNKKNNLSEEEEVYLDRYPLEVEKFKTSDPIITKFLNDNKHVRDLRKVFNDSPDTVFVDYCHILPEKNMIIAEKMVEDIMEYLVKKFYYE